MVVVRSCGGGGSMTSLCGKGGVHFLWVCILHKILNYCIVVGHVRFLPCHDVPGILWLELVDSESVVGTDRAKIQDTSAS